MEGRMIDRKILADDVQSMKTILLDLDDVKSCGLSDKQVVRAMCRCLFHILEWTIGVDNDGTEIVHGL